MTPTKNLVVPGEPKAKARPFVTNHHTFTPKPTMMYENYIKTLWLSAHGSSNDYTGSISLKVIACMTIPSSASKKKKVLMTEGTIKPTKRPDLDNIIKIVKDALNGIAWKDDSQVVELHGYKQYSQTPRLEIYIYYLEELK